jgi:hypothetical protein
MFLECISNRVKNEIEYEDILKCKAKAFNDFMERTLKAEENYLISALNKFS